MAGYVEKGRILTHELVGPSIWRMRLELPLIAKDAKPGQFIHVKVNDPTCILRRPISIAGTEPGKGILEIIYRIVGKGTEAMSHLKAGDVVDCLGPLGTAFDMDKNHIVGIGGRNKEEVFWKDLFPKTLKELIVTTDDGSYGIKGFSVSVLPELFKNGNVDEACVCGPGIMMRITAQMAKEANVPCEVSMERRMGCGIGTCLGCVCDRADGKGHYKVCVDGPVFKAEEVVL